MRQPDLAMHLGFFYLHEPEFATGGVTNFERSHNRQSEMEWVRVNVRTIGELDPICPWIPIIGYHLFSPPSVTVSLIHFY
jgi:hypothetical protein